MTDNKSSFVLKNDKRDYSSCILKNVKKEYNGRTILDIEDLTFEKGKTYAVLGLNGSGKTTLLRIIAGLDTQDSGEVISYGSIAYLSQEIYLFDMTVIQNMKLVIGSNDMSVALANEAISKVNMTSFYNQRAKLLSGGEKQRVAIARTLAQKKEIVLLDEPTAYVDIENTNLVEKYIREMRNETGSTIIFTTHNPSQAIRIADEVVILWDGELVEKGPPDIVFHQPEHEKTKMYLKNW